MKTRIRPTVLALLIATACATGRAALEPAPPLPALDRTAFEAAGTWTLSEPTPEESPGLHNVFHLSDDIVSGSEPEGADAFRKLSEMGIRTILSVDGKAPDHELAAEYGMRYVHVPIRYRGIADEEMLSIAKTFRELDGPFYVHCFHGKHRGPAAAAVGRLVLDGAPREQAVAEMRQWCGTSSKYEGLYAAIAFGDLPSDARTRGFAFDFPAEHRFAGFRSAMVDLTRSWDTIESLSARGWAPNPDHPDASARNEAAKMVEIFAQANGMQEVGDRPEDFRGRIDASEAESRTLLQLLDSFERGDAAAGEQAKVAAGRIKKLCTECHSAYRNKE